MIVNELVTKFSFKGSLKKLDTFKNSLRSSIITLSKYSAIMSASATAAALWSNKNLQSAKSMIRLAENTDLTIAQLQKLQYLAARGGVAGEDVLNSISQLTSKIGDAAINGSDDFNRLGVSVRDAHGNVRKTVDIMNDLFSSFKNLSKAQKFSFAEKLGLNVDLINAFSDKMDNLFKFLTLTKEQEKQLHDYYSNIETLKFAFSSLSLQMSLVFAPVVKKINKIFSDFLEHHGKQFLKIFNSIFEMIGRVSSAMSKLVSSTVGWKPILIGFGSTLLLAFPFLRITTLISSTILLFDDLIVAFKNGKSVINDLFKDFLKIDLKEHLKKQAGYINNFLKTPSDFEKEQINLMSKTIDNINIKVRDSLINAFKKAFDFIKNLIDFTTTTFFNLSMIIGDSLIDTFKKAFGFIKNLIDFTARIGDSLISGFKKAFDYLKNLSFVDILSDKISTIFNFDKFSNIFDKIPNIFENKNVFDNKINPDNRNSLLDTFLLSDKYFQVPLSNKIINNDIKIDVKSNDANVAGTSIVNSLERELSRSSFQWGVGGR